ncbi:glycosyltransferase [Actinomarinicola tropica]|uniref:Glycosyltransferase n=1 Tax=Actinomarinicola tropica TaxID=2789776 RepID=A0A5Q2RF36_9ACTN|nr:glycosyltransferase [Actinomarinicola tropica]QGG95468.1 glycosyltransferase [Actinomarinicola tropica]
MTPDITVIVPCRNEAADIGDCIAAIAAQDVARSEFEVLLVDGESDDGTVEAARAEAAANGLGIEVLENPDRTAATALNRGLSRARGRLIVRVDARSRITSGHLRRCREHLDDRRIGVVGGGQRPVARPGATLEERGIVRALSNRYTTGLARYRRSDTPGAVDTVWMGAFRRSDLERVGGWPVRPAQNQDYRLNQTLRAEGLQVWFDPTLTADYLPRRTLRALARQYAAFGRAKGTIWRSGGTFAPRHALLLAGPLLLGVGLVAVVRRKGLAPAGALAVAGLLVVDEVGSSSPASGQERAVAVVATLVADGAWLVGVVRGCARR